MLQAEVPDAASIAQLNAVNVTAPMALVNMVLADMKAAKYGVILTVSSGLAGMYMPYLAAYAASKAAINNYSAGLACELRVRPPNSHECCFTILEIRVSMNARQAPG